MNAPATINSSALPIKEYKGQRVVTFKDIDTVHGRASGTAKRNFNVNQSRFTEGLDYFIAKPADFQKYEIRTSEINNRGTVLMTESGYLMLAKSFTDDLAWKVQRDLVNNYFRARTAPEKPDELTELKIRAAADRAAAMKMNAENRRLKLLLDHPHLKDLSPIAQQTFELKAIESATGKDMGAFLPPCEELVQVSTLAEKWTKEFGVKVTSAMLGRLANQNGLKTDEYGVLAMDKAQHSNKEIPSFRYNPRGVALLKHIAMKHYGVKFKPSGSIDQLNILETKPKTP